MNPQVFSETPLPDLVFQAQSAHRAWHRANEVQGCVLLNIKSGGCPEDCAYCPQSAHYDTGVGRGQLLYGSDRPVIEPILTGREVDLMANGSALLWPAEVPA